MKKILSLSFIVLTIWLLGLTSAKAQVLSWDGLCDKYIALYGDSQMEDENGNLFKITKESDSLTIDLINDEISYNIKFFYKDNVISYINDRDYNSMSFETRFMYSIIDSILFQEVSTSILDSYNLNSDDLSLLEEMGAISVVTSDNSESPINLLDLDYENTKAIYIDLAKIDQYLFGSSDGVVMASEVVAPKYQSSNSTSQANENSSLKSAGNLENTVDNSNDNNLDNSMDSESSQLEKSSETLTTQGISNPKTLDLDSSKYLLFVGISFIGIIGLMFNFAKKNRFNN